MTIDLIENATPAREAEQLKSRRRFAKKPKATKKQAAAKKPASKPKADRSIKRAEVSALMKRTKGATLTVRGFVSILDSKAGEKIERSKSADGERPHKIRPHCSFSDVTEPDVTRLYLAGKNSSATDFNSDL